jgi:hypothetical protein
MQKKEDSCAARAFTKVFLFQGVEMVELVGIAAHPRVDTA